MKKSRFTETQIVAILNEAENNKLKRMFADLSLEIDALKELAEKHRRWGFWMCFQRLRNLGHRWNHKRVYRINKDLGLNHRRKTKRRVITREWQPLDPARASRNSLDPL